MEKYNSKSKIFNFLAIIFTFSFLVFNLASAQQTPQFMVTWKANNYAPASYLGKVLPAAGSQIDMAMELIESGQLANLSNTQIRWVANGQVLQNGTGLKTFSFNADIFKGDQTVEITILNYKGQSLDKKVTIPLVRPEVVINGGPNIFRALLYFFNITNVSQAKFTWSANGISTAGAVGNPDILNLDTSKLPAGTPISLGVEVQNLLKPLEIARQSINFVKK